MCKATPIVKPHKGYQVSKRTKPKFLTLSSKIRRLYPERLYIHDAHFTGPNSNVDYKLGFRPGFTLSTRRWLQIVPCIGQNISTKTNRWTSGHRYLFPSFLDLLQNVIIWRRRFDDDLLGLEVNRIRRYACSVFLDTPKFVSKF